MVIFCAFAASLSVTSSSAQDTAERRPVSTCTLRSLFNTIWLYARPNVSSRVLCVLADVLPRKVRTESVDLGTVMADQEYEILCGKEAQSTLAGQCPGLYDLERATVSALVWAHKDVRSHTSSIIWLRTISSTRLTVSGLGSVTSPKTNICSVSWHASSSYRPPGRTICEISVAYLYSLVKPSVLGLEPMIACVVLAASARAYDVKLKVRDWAELMTPHTGSVQRTLRLVPCKRQSSNQILIQIYVICTNADMKIAHNVLMSCLEKHVNIRKGHSPS
jgi:hypothetical protein